MSECTRNTLAAHKRLNKEFFPVDPFEDPPSPETVAIVVKCWHIMPLVRDEDEGEMWWILGPNNKTPQEASTAGPFKTKKEAFWTALEHNRTLGVNAVYVHGKNENGERSDGDFEEPSEEDFADTTTDGGCPYCGQNLTNTAVCKHFVGSLGDDDAGGDTVTPLYFGWTEHHDESHDNMIECLDGYFEALCGLCDQIVKAGADEAKRMRSEAKRLPPAERAILTQAVQLLDHLGVAKITKLHRNYCVVSFLRS